MNDLLTLLQKTFPFTFWENTIRYDGAIVYSCNSKLIFNNHSSLLNVYFINTETSLFEYSDRFYYYKFSVIESIILNIYKKYLLI